MPDAPPRSRTASFAWIVVAYAAGLAVAYVVARHFAGTQPLWFSVLTADVAATCTVFAFSVVLNNSSVYDPYWSVAPMAIAPALAVIASSPGVPPLRKWAVVALVLAWGARLTWNWARGWEGLTHEDWRYVDLRAKTGRAYWLVSFLGLHMMPTLWVYLGCLSLIPALSTGVAPIGPIDLAALAVTALAIWLETTADAQLRVFRLAGQPPGRIMDTGLWAHCRHPNYLGEILLWWGLYLFGLAADRGSWRNIVGPVAINALFVFVSIPLIDRRSLARRPGYAAHMRRIPALLPRPWKRAPAPTERTP